MTFPLGEERLFMSRGSGNVRRELRADRKERTQAVSGRFIRNGEIPKIAGDSCPRAQYCPNEVS